MDGSLVDMTLFLKPKARGEGILNLFFLKYGK